MAWFHELDSAHYAPGQMTGVHDLWVIEFRSFGKWELFAVSNKEDAVPLQMEQLFRDKPGVRWRIVRHSAVAVYSQRENSSRPFGRNARV